MFNEILINFWKKWKLFRYKDNYVSKVKYYKKKNYTLIHIYQYNVKYIVAFPGKYKKKDINTLRNKRIKHIDPYLENSKQISYISRVNYDKSLTDITEKMSPYIGMYGAGMKLLPTNTLSHFYLQDIDFLNIGDKLEIEYVDPETGLGNDNLKEMVILENTKIHDLFN